jgi:RNA-binding protein
MKLELSPIERKRLKAAAHPLAPVVMIGNEGLTPAVLKEVGRCLAAHELIKIRAFSDQREQREAWLDTICTDLSAAVVQHIGKILVVYRENTEKKPPATPKPRRKAPRLTKRQEAAKALGQRKKSR